MFRILLVLLLCITPCGWCCGTGGAAYKPASARAAVEPLNLNEITPEQLDELPGIGPALAERIIAYRDEHGPFASIDQLNDVKGIGDRTLERLRPYLVLE